MSAPTNSAQTWRDGVTVMARPGRRFQYDLTAHWHGVQVGGVRHCDELALPFAKESAHLEAYLKLSQAPTGDAVNGSGYEATP
jgi:hypothetical protein